MLNLTKRAIEDFDNQHDFERMGADILNALGYADVEPMAPGGGADGGRDIKFRDGDAKGIAFVTLEKKIMEKFRRDLAKLAGGEGSLALFCNVSVTPSQKVALSTDANARGFTLDVYDLERLRSLLDGSLRTIRRQYLGIDDAASELIRKDLKKLLRFPDAVPDRGADVGELERALSDQMPRRVFEALMAHDEKDVGGVPGIGIDLDQLMTDYYQFRQITERLEAWLLDKIGKRSSPRFLQAWRIQLHYCVERRRLSAAQLAAGPNFLNYGITWDEAERMFVDVFEQDADVSKLLTEWAEEHVRLSSRVSTLAARL